MFKYYLINLPALISNIGGASFAYNVLMKPFISSFGIVLDTMFKYFEQKHGYGNPINISKRHNYSNIVTVKIINIFGLKLLMLILNTLINN